MRRNTTPAVAAKATKAAKAATAPDLAANRLLEPSASKGLRRADVPRDWAAASADGLDITRGWLHALTAAPQAQTLHPRAMEEILSDDTVAACALQRIHGVLARAWEVQPGGPADVEHAAAQALREQINALDWDSISAQMLRGIFTGWAVAEARWEVRGSSVVLAELAVRDSARFGFDGTGRLRLKTFSHPSPGLLMPDRKFWVCRFGARHADDLWGHALAADLYWLVWLKRHALRFWSVYLEKFGTPTVMGHYPRGSSDGEQQCLLETLAAVQRDSTIIVPEGVQVQLLEAMRGGAADHAGFVQLIDRAITKAVLGQTATVEGQAGKLGANDEQDRVRLAIQQADADVLSASFNASIGRWWTDWNFGPHVAAAQLWRSFDHEGTAARLARDRAIFDMGFRPSLEYIRSTWGEHWSEAAPAAPDTPEPAKTAPASAPSSADHAQILGDNAPDNDDDHAATAAALALAAPSMQGVLARMTQAIEQAADMDAAADALLDVLGPVLDEGQLHRAMAAALELAALRGWQAALR